jgi:hypothetical protein
MAKKQTKKSSNAKRVYGFNVTKPDEPWFTSQSAWKAQMTPEGAKAYLTDHVKTQLTREVPVAITAFEEANKTAAYEAGFYGLARMIFPAISFLGSLYKGSDTTRHSVLFLEKYAGAKYRSFAATIFYMYRHGLIHTSMPKIVLHGGQLFGWHLVLNEPSAHLTTESGKKSKNIVISLKTLYEDVVTAIDAFAAEFDGPKKQRMLTTFMRGFLRMAAIDTIHAEKSPKMRSKLKKNLDAIS